MRIYKQTYRDRHTGEQKTARKWTVEWRDHNGKARRITQFADKRATEDLGRNLQDLADIRKAKRHPSPDVVTWLGTVPQAVLDKLIEINMVDRRDAHAAGTLADHLADYLQSIRNGDATEKHVHDVKGHVERIAKATDARYVDDLDGEAVKHYLAQRRRKGLANATSNKDVRHIKSFCRGMARQRRIAADPVVLVDPVNEELRRKHVRRDLSPEELATLLTKTYHGKERWRMSGIDRYWLYRVAAETGLRSSELRSLKVGSFHLDDDEPVVVVEAAFSKHRREDVIDLRRDTAMAIKTYVADRPDTEPLWQMPKVDKVVHMLRADLDAADIPYEDSAGRVCDFHALRNTFITNAGYTTESMRDLQALARHSTPTLTARYAKARKSSMRAAIESMPASPLPTDEQEDDSARRFARRLNG